MNIKTICTLTVALLLSACTPENPASSKDPQVPEADSGRSTGQEGSVTENAPQTDEAQILGTWRSVRFEKDGLVDPTGSGGKAVFEKENAFIHGLPFFSYKLDPQQTPKHFSTSSTKAIYRLQDDTLTICMATSGDGQRPTEFATKQYDDRNLVVFKRAYPLDTNAPEAEFDPELRAKIKQGIELLEAGKLREFLECMGLPISEELLANEIDSEFKQRMEQRLATLKVLLKVKPKLNAAQDKATFDVSNIHIEGGIAYTWWFNFVRKDGEWHAVEYQFPLVE